MAVQQGRKTLQASVAAQVLGVALALEAALAWVVVQALDAQAPGVQASGVVHSRAADRADWAPVQLDEAAAH